MNRFLCFVIGLTALVSVAQGQVTRQTAKAKPTTAKQTWTPPRTPDGQPDLQGFWANNNATPLERPKELAGRATLTDEEVAAMKKKAHELFSGKGDAAFGDTVFLAVLSNVQGTKTGFKSTDGETGDYSSVWTVERDWDNRTSLITDPPDGRIPAMTPDAQKRRQAALAAYAASGHGARGPIVVGTLYHLRLAAADRGIPKLLSDCADAHFGGDHDGDDSRCPRHSAGWPSARSRRGAAVAGGFARPLGRRYAGRRYDQLQAKSLHVGVQR